MAKKGCGGIAKGVKSGALTKGGKGTKGMVSSPVQMLAKKGK